MAIFLGPIHVYTCTLTGETITERKSHEKLHPLLVSCVAGVRRLPGRPARSAWRLCSRESLRGRLPPPGTRVFQSYKQRGAAARSSAPVFADGAVFECQ